MQNTPRPRRGARLVTGTLAGLALAVAVPLAASAHVGVSPDHADAGAKQRLTFGFSHGCEDSPTTALVFDIPEGVTTVKPVIDASWTIDRELGANGVPTQITYTAVAPIESDLAASVALDVTFASGAANSDVAFPVTQVCVVGSAPWTELVPAGADHSSVENPAPVVTVGAVAEEDGHGHGATDAAAPAETATATDAVDPVARALGIAGISIGVVGLGLGVTLAIASRRSHKA